MTENQPLEAADFTLLDKKAKILAIEMKHMLKLAVQIRHGSHDSAEGVRIHNQANQIIDRGIDAITKNQHTHLDDSSAEVSAFFETHRVLH